MADEYKKEIEYPLRFDEYMFEEADAMQDDEELQKTYDCWKQCINYETKRKIKFKGLTWKKIRLTFLVDETYGCHYKQILYVRDRKQYLEETAQIYKKIDEQNKQIQLFNKDLREKKEEEFRKSIQNNVTQNSCECFFACYGDCKWTI